MAWSKWFFYTLLIFVVFLVEFVSGFEIYEGYVLINGEMAPNGTSVSVEVSGTSEFIGDTILSDSDGSYSIFLRMDSPYTKKDDGAESGDKLVWYINGEMADRPAPLTDLFEPNKINSFFIVSIGETRIKIIEYSPIEPNQWLNEGENVTFSANAVGPMHSNLTYRWFLDGIEISTSNTLNFAYSTNVTGTTKISVNVSDDSGGWTTKEWNVTINTPPQIQPPIPPVFLRASEIHSLNLTKHGKDAETPPQRLTWEVICDDYFLPAFAHINNTTQVLTVIPSLLNPRGNIT